MDFLEHEAVNDVIIMGVVLEEVRHRNSSVYQRLRALSSPSATKRFFVFNNEHHRSNPYMLPCKTCSLGAQDLSWRFSPTFAKKSIS